MEFPTAAARTRELAPIAYDRARSVGPPVLGGIVIGVVASDLVGLPLAPVVLAWNLFIIPVFAGVLWLLHQRRIPQRHGHHALFAVWVVPTFGTLFSIVFNNDPRLTYLLTIELAAGAVLLQTRWLAVSYLLIGAVWIKTVHAGDHVALFAILIFASQSIGIVLQRVLSEQLATVIESRRLQETTSEQLAAQLAELRRSEAERERLSEQLVHAQRMEAVGTLSAGLAHDMNNILGSITSFAELAREVASAQVGEDLEHIISQAKRGAELTRGLLAFSRRGKYRKEVFALATVIEEVMGMLARTLPKTVELRTDLSALPAYLEGDAAQVAQVLVNLVTNANDAMSGRGVIDVSSRIDNGCVQIAVRDTGVGMDEATRRRAFEPFFTTKSLGKGTGLGLATVWGIITGHGGTVDVQSVRGKGTTIVVTLPLSAARPPALVVAPVIEPAKVKRQTSVLVVDDEPLVRTGTRRILERAGYVVLEASNGAEALDLYAANATEIGLVVLDMSMPVMGGPECFAKLREHSTVPVLVTTGHTSDELAQRMVARGAAFLEKPYASADLKREASRLLAR